MPLEYILIKSCRSIQRNVLFRHDFKFFIFRFYARGTNELSDVIFKVTETVHANLFQNICSQIMFYSSLLCATIYSHPIKQHNQNEDQLIELLSIFQVTFRCEHVIMWCEPKH